MLVTEEIEAFAQCFVLRRRVPSERSPRGIKEGNQIHSGGMIFWNVLRGTNVSEEPAAYLAGQNNVWWSGNILRDRMKRPNCRESKAVLFTNALKKHSGICGAMSENINFVLSNMFKNATQSVFMLFLNYWKQHACAMCINVYGIALHSLRYTSWYNVPVWRSACKLENPSVLVQHSEVYVCKDWRIHVFTSLGKEARFNHVNEWPSSRPVVTEIELVRNPPANSTCHTTCTYGSCPAAVSTCHEGVWRSGGMTPYVWTVVFWDERLVYHSYRFTVGGRAHWYLLDGRRRVGPKEPWRRVAKWRYKAVRLNCSTAILSNLIRTVFAVSEG
jgi:hypothetical protein